MAALHLVTKNDRPAHLIRIAVPRLNKNNTIAEYIREMKARDYDW